MSNAYIGEIRMWSSARIPVDWAACDGRQLSVQDHNPLFTLIGTTYGGDGVNSFALPDLRGRVPVGAGQGVGLTPRALGESGGETQVTLTPATIPSHTHVPYAGHGSATDTVPGPDKLFGITSSTVRPYVDLTKPLGATAAFSPNAIDQGQGQGRPHQNMMPSAAVTYIICVNGIYPST